jgi:hypothetical protein
LLINDHSLAFIEGGMGCIVNIPGDYADGVLRTHDGTPLTGNTFVMLRNDFRAIMGQHAECAIYSASLAMAAHLTGDPYFKTRGGFEPYVHKWNSF